MISDSKSGVSGAGRKAEVGILLAEASDNFKAYGVKGHRHLPEIEQGLKAIAVLEIFLLVLTSQLFCKTFYLKAL